ncbi:DUF3368 domain-containing protein [Granulicella sp. WH15]|uniref:DUF3368 domain-containing protein n=1 Tax=Granulicella sp. WH15 TaxID=2602070 RepID=UPI0013676007|nr:DUF3368 domain-containing protein [Granulicella sp. WH15]QHN03121.1 DUF3368 domain-containing protein [Granulicella sp. WH15]
MIVVADTTPLNYLVLIDEIELLPAIFGTVLIPEAVLRELLHPKTPAKVREWIGSPPKWLEVRAVVAEMLPQLMDLDPGEREAIQLALEVGADAILIDEADGRRHAERLQLEVRGTLGVLERAAKLGKTDLLSALDRLDKTSFRLSPALRAAFLKRNY